MISRTLSTAAGGAIAQLRLDLKVRLQITRELPCTPTIGYGPSLERDGDNKYVTTVDEKQKAYFLYPWGRAWHTQLYRRVPLCF